MIGSSRHEKLGGYVAECSLSSQGVGFTWKLAPKTTNTDMSAGAVNLRSMS